MIQHGPQGRVGAPGGALELRTSLAAACVSCPQGRHAPSSGGVAAGDDEAASYDVGTASAALEKCSKAQLQAAVLKAVLNNQISKQELRDLG